MMNMRKKFWHNSINFLRKISMISIENFGLIKKFCSSYQEMAKNMSKLINP